MSVKVIDKTSGREKTVCTAARGDYMHEWNGDMEFSEIMDVVDYNEDDLKRAKKNNHYPDETDETEAKMISFLEKQLSRGHYGPMEQSSITFAVKGVSRVTMAQITRHRHMTFDIQSMRYADFSEQEIVTPKSLTEGTLSREKGVTDVDSQKELEQLYEMYVEDAVEFYERMVRNGVPKEDARFILPLGTTVNMTFSGNARTFMHVFNLRQKASSQWEIRELSNMLAEELKQWMPYSFSWYEQNKPHKIGP